MQPDGFGVIDTQAGFELPNQPLAAKTLQQCIDACAADLACVAFSRQIGLSSSATADCYLKNGGLAIGVTPFNGWTTYIETCPGHVSSVEWAACVLHYPRHFS